MTPQSNDRFHIGLTLTTLLALWGAILSSVTFGWNLLRDIKDRAKVRLTAKVAVIVPQAGGGYLSLHPQLLSPEQRTNLQIIVSVANIGRRPLRWSGLGGKYKKPVREKESFFIMTRHLPRTLAEAEAHDEHAELDEAFILDNIKTIFIWDSFDRKWKLPGRELRKVIKDAKIYASQRP